MIHQIAQRKKFRILGWNVWIFEENRSERINALVAKIQSKPPDFIIFVENTPQAQKIIEEHPFIRQHYFTSIVTPQTQQSTYKTSILSRFQPSAVHLYDVPWSTRRSVVADFDFKTEKTEFSFSIIGNH